MLQLNVKILFATIGQSQRACDLLYRSDDIPLFAKGGDHVLSRADSFVAHKFTEFSKGRGIAMLIAMRPDKVEGFGLPSG